MRASCRASFGGGFKDAGGGVEQKRRRRKEYYRHPPGWVSGGCRGERGRCLARRHGPEQERPQVVEARAASLQGGGGGRGGRRAGDGAGGEAPDRGHEGQPFG